MSKSSREYQKEWARKYRAKNREKVNKLSRECRERKLNNMTEEERQDLRRSKADYDREYRAKNKETIAKKQKIYSRRRHKERVTDPVERFMLNVRFNADGTLDVNNGVTASNAVNKGQMETYVQSFVGGAVTSALSYKGTWDASGGTLPVPVSVG